MTWQSSQYECPVCGSLTQFQEDSDEGRVYEHDERCPNPKCGLFTYEYGYGNSRERIGYAVFEWGYSDGSDLWHERKAARAEMTLVFAHPDYAAIREHAPLLAAAGWLEDHDFPIQSAAVMQHLAQGTTP